MFQALLAPLLAGDAIADDAFQKLAIAKNLQQSDFMRTISDVDPATPDQFAAVVEAAARSAALPEATQLAKQFAVLLNNQPQLFGSMLYRARTNVAGSHERSVRVTYEMGFHNLNAFYAAKPACVDPETENATQCAKDLIAFAGGGAPGDTPANRFALSFEYQTSSRLNVAIPKYSVDFSVPKAHTLKYSLTYGRNAMKGNRLDVSLGYEDTTVAKPTDNTASVGRGRLATLADANAPGPVQDRFVASATYTYKISDAMAIPVALIYANHASFLGDVDRKLNAHFGITYKIPNPR